MEKFYLNKLKELGWTYEKESLKRDDNTEFEAYKLTDYKGEFAGYVPVNELCYYISALQHVALYGGDTVKPL